ncbi:MAG: hypothetical protein K2P81_09445 [Bacteriovoracaceae bacterium]|nr:hypothetical protein [Bacteriovoracaceae bacterium]
MRDSNNNNRNRRPRRPSGNGGPQNPNQQQQQPPRRGPGPSNGQGNRNAAPFRRSRRRRSGRPLSPAQVVQKYLNLLELHLNNRRKYYEHFNREDGRHRRRLEKNFFSTIEQLRRFEERLDPRQKEALLNHVERYRLDLTYSGNHDLAPQADPVPFEGEFEDPHFTEDQKEAFRAYAEDREETSGCFADYEAYKASK